MSILMFAVALVGFVAALGVFFKYAPMPLWPDALALVSLQVLSIYVGLLALGLTTAVRL